MSHDTYLEFHPIIVVFFGVELFGFILAPLHQSTAGSAPWCSSVAFALGVSVGTRGVSVDVAVYIGFTFRSVLRWG